MYLIKIFNLQLILIDTKLVVLNKIIVILNRSWRNSILDPNLSNTKHLSHN